MTQGDTVPQLQKFLWKIHFKCEGKADPLQAWTGPEGSRKLRLPDFLTTAQDIGRLSALRTGRIYPQEIFLVRISVEAESTPMPYCSRKDFVNEKFQ